MHPRDFVVACIVWAAFFSVSGVSIAHATTETFTSSTTWTAPVGVTSVSAEVWGGGAGGGGDTAGAAGGGAGGGGAYSIKTVSVTPGNIYTVTVGTGGAGGSTAGTDGGNSWFNNSTDVSAEGGKRAIGIMGGQGGLSSNGFGDTRYSGGTGGAGAASLGGGGGGGSSAGTSANGNSGSNAVSTTGGAGGTAPTGGAAGGAGGNSNAVGTNGSDYGGGGGGRGYNGASSGNGAAGKVTLTYASGVSVSGTLYSDEEITPLASKTIAISVNGAAAAGTTTTNGSGAYTLSSIAISAGDVLTLYVDDATEDAVTVTVATGSNMTGVNLYQDRLIVRHDNSGSLTNTNLNTADNNGDTDISSIYSFSSGNLTLASGKELFILASHTFAPGGDVTTPSFDLRGTYTHSTETLTISSAYEQSSGTFSSSSGVVDVNGTFTLSGGTFNAPSGTFSVSGSWSKTGGTFTSGGNTVTFDGTNQTISGTTTFANFAKVESENNGSDETLTFAAGATQTITGTWTLSGTDGDDRILLVSSSPGQQWNVDSQGTRTMDYIGVTDSKNTNATSISCFNNCTNGGNNTKWTFPSPPELQSLSSSSKDGIYGPEDTITIIATYDEELDSPSTLTVLLSNGVSITLETIDDFTLTGTYTVGETGSKEDSSDLTGESISDESVRDMEGTIQTDSSFPSDDDNIAHSSDLVVDTTAPPAPTASPAGGTYLIAKTVRLSPSDTTTIYYTLDDSSPTSKSTQYSDEISIADTTVLQAIRIDEAGNVSSVMKEEYTIVIGTVVIPSLIFPIFPIPTPYVLPPSPTPQPEHSPEPKPSSIPQQTLRSLPLPPTPAGVVVASLLSRILPYSPEQIIAFTKDAGPIIASVAAAAGIATVVPGIATNIIPYIAQWIQVFGGFFTLRRKGARWGVVVDSDVGQPISHVVVQVFDSQFQQLKETQTTGSDGQFGFLLPPGKYSLVASQTGFIFPARKNPPTILGERERLYTGQEFEIDKDNPEAIPHFVIPLDREVETSTKQVLVWRSYQRILSVIDRIGMPFLFIGALLNICFMLMVPGIMSVILTILYLLLFILKLVVLVSHTQGIGRVLDAGTKQPLDLALIRLYEAKTNRIIQTRVTNIRGSFFLLVPRGSYNVSISKAGYTTVLVENVHITGSASKALAMEFTIHPVSEQVPQ